MSGLDLQVLRFGWHETDQPAFSSSTIIASPSSNTTDCYHHNATPTISTSSSTTKATATTCYNPTARNRRSRQRLPRECILVALRVCALFLGLYTRNPKTKAPRCHNFTQSAAPDVVDDPDRPSRDEERAGKGVGVQGAEHMTRV